MIIYLHGLLTRKKDGYFHITENKCDENITEMYEGFKEKTKKNRKKGVQKVECYPGPNQDSAFAFSRNYIQNKMKNTQSLLNESLSSVTISPPSEKNYSY